MPSMVSDILIRSHLEQLGRSQFFGTILGDSTYFLRLVRLIVEHWGKGRSPVDALEDFLSMLRVAQSNGAIASTIEVAIREEFDRQYPQFRSKD